MLFPLEGTFTRWRLHRWRNSASFTFGLFLAGVSVTTSARAEWIAVDEDEYVFYERDSATYDPADDVLAVYIDHSMYGEFWKAFRCGSATTWDDSPAPGRWVALESDAFPLRDALCAQRETLPFRDF